MASSSGSGEIEDGVAIVYARSRRSSEEIARTLRGHGIGAEHYHAGLEAAERTRVQDGVRRRPDAGGRRDDGVRDGDRQAERPARGARQLSGLARELRPDGRPRRPRRPTERHGAARRRRRRGALSPIRAGRRSRHPTCCAVSTGRCATRRQRRPGGAGRPAGGTHDPRVLVGMLEQAGIVRRGYDAGRAMRIELLPVGDGGGRGARRPARALCPRGRGARGADRRVRRDDAVPPPPGGGALRRDARDAVRRLRRLRTARRARSHDPQLRLAAPRRRLPGRSSTRSTASPGRSGGAASSRCSAARVKAPPSARRSPAFGVLAAASDAEVTRWVRALETAGALVEVETRRLPRAAGRAPAAGCRRSGRRRDARGHDARRRASAPGARGGRARTACRRTSCSTTRRSRELAAARPRARQSSRR